MPAYAVIGGQWGDEGKGKIVDYLAQNAHAVVRYNGGGNAGHTVDNDKGVFKLRTVPCGVFSTKTELTVVGSGVVWRPDSEGLVKELKELEAKGVDFSALRIDCASNLVMPWHILEDKLDEESRGSLSLGTTGNGIGPAYADKHKRVALRAEELLNFPDFGNKFRRLFFQKSQSDRRIGKHLRNCPGCEACKLLRDSRLYLSRVEYTMNYLAGKFGNLANLICDTPPLLYNLLDRGAHVLLEGAQGALLDIDHGSYPYVTSSATGSAAAAQGSGIAITDIKEVLAVFKSYVSRIGNGPNPTRIGGNLEASLREKAAEFGTVTGRPRNLGWFDTVMAKRVLRMNGATGVAITRLDILDGLYEIGIGVGYDCHPGPCQDPSHALRSERVRAQIDYLPGWAGNSANGCKLDAELPHNAREYVKRISCGVPIKLISVGSKREETICVSPVW